MSAGLLYALTNPAMPGLVKIGRTCQAIESRIKQLSSATGVPCPFELLIARSTSDCHGAEEYAHSLLEFWQEPRREFFRVPTLMGIMACETAIKMVIGGEDFHLDAKWFDRHFVQPKVAAEIAEIKMQEAA